MDKKITIDQYLSDLANLQYEMSNIAKDIAVLAADEFDKNFDRQAFFNEKWRSSKYVDRENERMSKKESRKRKILQKTGALRKSIRYTINGRTITFGSSVKYAEIHNEGGDIEHPGGTAFFKKGDKMIWVSNRKAYRKKYPRTNPHTISIPQRQFVGEHPMLDKMIENEVINTIKNALQ